ncbi:hypothetical protein EV356DRAFT_503581 [Viridothelium virens]|uniref:Zn(2)-C6 fungal-type domain-containing protein n=1 Tax=Viridothelium virens TaxID=1048519 RepID=A0A6A6H6E3_VIRVR|nr:hypothetical protein EV356DRAFT_503581 [Viridothelium virens]
MDLESSLSAADSPESSRRDRAAIAAQACETCRSRKSKCDEKRPQCSLCQRLNVPCHYREPQPTKKDKTLVEILASLQRLETKVDAINPSLNSTPSLFAAGTSSTAQPRTPQSEHQNSSELEALAQYATERPAELTRPLGFVTAAHKVLLWPSTTKMLLETGSEAALDIQHIKRDGTRWFHKLQLAKHALSLPVDIYLHSTPVSSSSSSSNTDLSPERVCFPSLTEDIIRRYVLQYFNTYHVLYPLLDEDGFWNDHLVHVLRYGFGDRDFSSTLCLLVLALGKVAEVAHFAEPISRSHGRPSGLQLDAPEHPPGLEIFNEALKRLGFVIAQCSIENIQATLLTSIYYESCGRHMDFRRLSVHASMSCQVYIRCAPIDWSSPHGDLVRRNYWTCNLIENWYHLDLDLQQTGINDFEGEVSLPTFEGSKDNTKQKNRNVEAERASIQLPFLAMIAMRQLTTSAHAAIHDAATSRAESAEHYGGPPIHVIAELSRQLENWRAVLPNALQWIDEERMVISGSRGTTQPVLFSFNPPADGSRVNYKYNIDIVTAQLRARYYYARFIIYRPFVYKALHYPYSTSAQDAEGVVTCLESALSWPIIMYPPKAKKRLIPFLFAWTQNIIGILLILRMSLEDNMLGRISRKRIPQVAVEETVKLMLDWIQDVKQEDGAAEWCWQIVQPLYKDLFREGELS